MEEIALLTISAVLIIIAVSSLAPKLGVAAPVLLVLVGIVASVIPSTPVLVIEPEWILTIVLPPLLYSAAVNMPTTDFRRDFGAIGSLSVLLVIVSAFVSGTLIWMLFPDLGYAAAIAVGAVISPPDAVAATAIGKRLGLPPRLVTILEGEGLVNDATALVMMRSAIAATAGAISFWGAIGDFLYAVAIGVVVGAVIGALSVWVRSKINQPVLATALSLVVPFLAFFPAEELNASGVLAVVVTGLVTGAQSAKRFSAQDRISERTNWRTIQLLLENGVFLLMGYEITGLIDDVEEAGLNVWTAVGIGALATVVLVLVRCGFTIPLVAVLRRGQRRGREQARYFEAMLRRIESAELPPSHEPRRGRAARLLRRKHADASFFANEGLGWRGGAVLAWSGMRGVVTLAAAQSLPHDFPYRSQLILVAFTVAILTLVGQGATLPLLIRALGIRGTDAEEAQREFALLVSELGAATRAFLDNPELRRSNGEPFPDEVVAQVRKNSLAVAESADTAAIQKSAPLLLQRNELMRMLVDAEQAALLDARASGSYRSHTIEAAQHLIDTNAARLEGGLRS